jgi:hypothetical protein
MAQLTIYYSSANNIMYIGGGVGGWGALGWGGWGDVWWMGGMGGGAWGVWGWSLCFNFS